MTETWTLASEALDAGALGLLRFEIRDRLSGLYEITVDVRTSGGDDTIDANLDALLSAPAYLGTDADGGRKIWGVVRSVELQTTHPTAAPTYRFVLVPRLWRATLTVRSRVFQDASVVEIVSTVLDGMGMKAGSDYELRLTSSYPKREYVVQYEESNYALISRLLEDEGIATHFEAGTEGEKLVLSDANTGMPPSLGDLPYAGGGAHPPAGTIVALTHAREALSREVVLVDYDWRNPSLQLEATAAIDPHGHGLLFSGSRHYRDPARGRHLAHVRAQEARVRRDVYSGKTSTGKLHAGDRFTLTGHFVHRFDGEYLVLEARHRYGASDPAAPTKPIEECTFVAIHSSTHYRPPRVTPRPRIDGVLYATIDGPEIGTPAPVDDLGRYKVILPFDVAAEAGGKASRWIRMAQALTGPGFGVHFPLREGAEVVLAHVEGDPDRPVIVGAVPNALTPSPVTRANPTQSMVRTSSGIQLEFEDDA